MVLSPFEELTRAVSAATASAANVIPAITVLKRHLSPEESTDAGIKTMKSTLLEVKQSTPLLHWLTQDTKTGKSCLIQNFICNI